METQNCAEPFVFIVPVAPTRQIIGLVAVCLFLLPATILSWLLIFKGAATRPDGILVLALCGMSILASGVFLWLSFPRFKSAARLEFRRNVISFMPAPLDRLMYEPVNASIQPNDNGILLRYHGARYKLLIQAESGGEHETGIALLTELSARDASELTNGISAATGLPARIVMSRRLANGKAEDFPWQPRSTAAKLATVGKLAFGTLPLWAGAIAGFVAPSIVVIGEVGLALWLAQTLAIVAYVHLRAGKAKFPWLYWASTIFTFGALYTAMAVFMSFKFHSH